MRYSGTDSPILSEIETKHQREYLEQKENFLKSYYELKEKFIKYSNDTIHGK